MHKELSVERLENNSLSLKGFPESMMQDDWESAFIGYDHIILRPKKRNNLLGALDSGSLFSCDVETYSALLIGLNEKNFTGILAVDTGRGIKRLFWDSGEIIFAGSNLIDDRLGEVMYRAGNISLEQMTNFAVQVNRTIRFGKVLLNNKVFSSIDLWNSLKLQVSEILCSTFLVERVFVQAQSMSSPPGGSVVFEQGTNYLIAECSGFGAMFRRFTKSISMDSTVAVLDKDRQWKEPAPGTYDGDLVELVRQYNDIRQIIENSKLTDINTLVGLFGLVSRGLCRVNFNGKLEKPDGGTRDDAYDRVVKTYRYLIESVRKRFSEESKTLPIEELQNFLRFLYLGHTPLIFVTNDGHLTDEAEKLLAAKFMEGRYQSKQVIIQLESLIQFLLQLTSDYLSYEKTKQIRIELEKFSAKTVNKT